MAQRRMFAKTIIDSDAFLDMPATAQLLYFHLSMRADDDGFINKPKTIMRMTGCKDDDINLLIAKKFIIPFETGIVVIKHWKIHNYIAKDRYTETKYTDEKSLLTVDKNNAYTLCEQPVYNLETTCIQNRVQPVYNLETQVREGKDSEGKDSEGECNLSKKTRKKHGMYKNVLLSDDEFKQIQVEFPDDFQNRIDRLSTYMISSGKMYDDHLATIRLWAHRDGQPQYHPSTQVTEEVNWEAVNEEIQRNAVGR